MCTIIKVKRKITDDPVDCLILECKKKKMFLEQTSVLDETNEESVNKTGETVLNDSKSFQFNSDRIDSIKQILKYAGSAKSENDIKATLLELSSRIRNYPNNNKKDLKSHFPSPTNNQLNKTNESKKELKTNRYVLLNKKRGIQNDTPITSIKTKSFKTDLNDFNIIDVISSDYINNETESDLFDSPTTAKTERLTCNGIEMIREKCVTSTAIKQPKLKETNAQVEFDSKTNEYVYDIYYTKNMDIHLDLLYPSNFEIKSATDDDKIELLDENGAEAEDFLEDDEDSNDEGNWRNDYPDEDEDDDIDNEDDDIYRGSKNAYSKYETYDDYDDNYNEYGYGNDEDEEVDDKLTSYMKKSCNIDGSFYGDDSENDDFDEYDNETSKAYSAYKKKLIKDIDN